LVVVVCVLVMFIMSSMVSALTGPVRKDPVTGVWRAITDEELKNDPRFHDSRAPSEGDDVFGSQPSEQAPSLQDLDFSSAPVHSKPVATRRGTASRKLSKYSAELGLSNNVQTESSASSPEWEEIYSQNLVQQDSSSIQAFVHVTPNPPPSLSVRVRVLGNLCRFQGYQPLEGCPIEAINGCVDRLPCNRTCAEDGYFMFRCLGPSVMTPADLAALNAEASTTTPVPTPAIVSDAYIANLSAQIKLAIQQADYTTLAKLLVSAKTSGASSVAHLAAEALLQTERDDRGEEVEEIGENEY